MKRTVVLPGRYAGAGLVPLMLSLFFLSGCSGGGNAGDITGETAGPHGLKVSEFIALKKANKGTGNFQKALQSKRIEKLQEQGVVVPTTGSGKPKTRPH